MSSAADCREIRHALGVYVLGAIEPGDRTLVDEHLTTCADCREELASLAGLPALLRRVPTAEAERLAMGDADDAAAGETPPENLLPSLLARTARSRRVSRWRELAAAAVVVVLALGAGAAGATLLQSGQAGPQHVAVGHREPAWHTVSAMNARTGAILTVRYAPRPWGTTMTVHVSGIRSGTVCEFQVTDNQGHHWVVGGWRVNYPGWPVWYPASTSLADANLHSFEVTAGGKVLATVSAA
jgi:predicted anti-sigma-YlaC factor YlaD